MVSQYSKQIARFPRRTCQSCGCRLPHAASGNGRLEPVRVLRRETRNRESVGDSADSRSHVLGRPSATGSLQDVRLFPIGDDEAVVVGEVRVLEAASTALTVLLEQRHDDLDGSSSRGAPLQPQAQEIHSRQPGSCVGLIREDGLVSDRHAVFVGADLGTPHPERPAQEDGVGRRRLRNLDPCAANARERGVGCGGDPLEHL